MVLQISNDDRFERRYKSKFNAIAAEHGISVNYEDDRAAIDTGLHLTQPRKEFEAVTNTRVWFQLKGIKNTTLPLTKFNTLTQLSINLRIEHLRHWYQSSEPVYLVLYIESADIFLVEDTKVVIDRQWGDRILKVPTFKNNQKYTSASISINSLLDKLFWRRLLGHRSMRIDGDSYRGNPLPHSRDQQSDFPLKMDPNLFTDIISTILSQHRYRVTGEINATDLYPNSENAGDLLSLSLGRMYDTYEWVPQLTAEIGVDEEGFREEGQLFRIQGRCAVLIHSLVISKPDVNKLREFARSLLSQNIKHLLVFVNHYAYLTFDGPAFNCFPQFSQGVWQEGIECIPQHLEDLGRNILTATNVYLGYRDRIDWWTDLTHRKVESGEWKIINVHE